MVNALLQCCWKWKSRTSDRHKMGAAVGLSLALNQFEVLSKVRQGRMLTIFLAIAPVFALILMGYGLRRGGISSTEFWNLSFQGRLLRKFRRRISSSPLE
jgi:hypothetical protein